jgi:hypothetical protein
MLLMLFKLLKPPGKVYWANNPALKHLKSAHPKFGGAPFKKTRKPTKCDHLNV